MPAEEKGCQCGSNKKDLTLGNYQAERGEEIGTGEEEDELIELLRSSIPIQMEKVSSNRCCTS